MIRSFRSSSSTSAASAVVCQSLAAIIISTLHSGRRFQQGWGGVMGNSHMRRPEVKQHDGVDDIVRVRGEQQKWLNHEQYSGYSDSYLKREMQFNPQYEYMNHAPITSLNKYLKEITEICYEVYGEAADALEEAELNPLHPRFKELVQQARESRQKLEKEIDRLYPDAHPTVKTMYDAMLVRRWQTLEDWIELVQKKREDTLNRLSPEWIEELEKQRGIAEDYMTRLRHLGTAMNANPTAFLEVTGEFTEKELVMIARRKKFFKQNATWAKNISAGDYNPH